VHVAKHRIEAKNLDEKRVFMLFSSTGGIGRILVTLRVDKKALTGRVLVSTSKCAQLIGCVNLSVRCAEQKGGFL
jgi:hypothetical protein